MISHKQKQVLIVDYSDCRGESMIEVYEAAKNLAITQSRTFPVLNIFNSKTIVTPVFLRFIEGDFSSVEHLVEKQAIIGLSTIQKWIVIGYNKWSKRPIVSCNTYEEALKFLVDDNSDGI